MKVRCFIIMVLTVLSAAASLFPRIVLNASATAIVQDTPKKQAKRRVLPINPNKKVNTARDYSRFSHRSDKHKTLACDACHTAPTPNWQISAGFPDVADFPGHESCIRCHRTELFKGARPVICSICHTKVSPRGKERFAFTKPNQPSEFNTIFPHDKHQDVIAGNRADRKLFTAHAIQNTMFPDDKVPQKYNNCTICHETANGTPSSPTGFLDSFLPPVGTFKTAPSGHASCFNCHWKNQAPTHETCSGCHGLAQTDIPILLAPKRISLKFKHAREQHEAECTVCHINITRVKSVLGLRPDVPITSCAGSSCHGARPDRSVITIETEIDQRARDAGFVCSKCHTSDVGKRAAPASHRAALTD